MTFEEEMLEFLRETSPNDPRHVITRHWVSRLRVWRMRAAGDDHPALYNVARDICHELGMPWTDPRSGVTFEPPSLAERIAKLNAELTTLEREQRIQTDALRSLERDLTEFSR